jgi:hypothetical protein
VTVYITQVTTIWCEAEGCTESFEAKGSRREVVGQASMSGWVRRNRDGWHDFCPSHTHAAPARMSSVPTEEES